MGPGVSHADPTRPDPPRSAARPRLGEPDRDLQVTPALHSAGHELRQPGEIAAKVAAIGPGESVGLKRGMGGDNEVGDQVLARPALSAVGAKVASCEHRRIQGRGAVDDREAVQKRLQFSSIENRGEKLGCHDIANHEFAFGARPDQSLGPSTPLGLTLGDGEQN